MTKPILVVMTRWPASGRCKRRLARTLGCSQAAGIQARLIAHTLAVAQGLAKNGTLRLHIAISGAGPGACRRWLASIPEASISAQGRGDLGNRMQREVLRARALHPGAPVILIGTDLPELNPDDLRQAVERLKQHDLVLGPASDGGYWLLGIGASLICSPQHWPLIGIPWGGPSVLEATLEAARRRQLSSALVAQRNDLDHWSDLMPWQG